MSDLNEIQEAQAELSKHFDRMMKQHDALEKNTMALAGVVADLMGAVLVLIRNEGKDPNGEAMKIWERAEKFREQVGIY